MSCTHTGSKGNPDTIQEQTVTKFQHSTQASAKPDSSHMAAYSMTITATLTVTVTLTTRNRNGNSEPRGTPKPKPSPGASSIINAKHYKLSADLTLA